MQDGEGTQGENMLDMREIENTIEMLENGETTFANCEKLASLYIVREHLQTDETEKEINDILPSYRVYADKKEKYSRYEVPAEAVLYSLGGLCSEIKDLVHIVYVNTGTEDERQKLKELIEHLYNQYVASTEA